MTLQTHEFGEAVVLECRGRLTVGGATYVFGEALQELVHDHGTVILDFSKLEQLDCAALGVIASCVHEARQRKCKIGCFSASPTIRTMLELMRLGEFIEFYEGDEQFLAKLAARAA